ncbi:hypothetical protein MUK71_06910 [Arthrobacter zhangbolii]|uniref:Uncharacterized protein n=1 Tax=Arthrobacter zhangbolii TaxID=2886936 RepID=A0A9X1M7Q6_9MICC|nr:hypothetical protein [Arthrobacter zhangbolii]MCC3271849.1 hypothetical protein [Arthrobacter zhangbolii]MCC3293753.1 hypothetical protein [Arthrobacter zhangbolii]UON93326.1 hypothetical protein MUK71_06910 [Arthrobacter zhangbolii]
MDILHSFLVFLHILGAAIIVGLWFARIKNPTVLPGQFHGALLQLVTGLALVAVNEMGDGDVNHMKVGIKLLIALVIAVLAFIGQRRYKKDEKVSAGLANSVGILTIVNIALATMW